VSTPEEMETDLVRVIVTGAIAHAENILVMLRQHEAEGLDHATSIRTLHREFVTKGVDG
jgi:hypothetical protein